MRNRHSVFIKILIIICLMIITVPGFASGASSDDALTRGGRFSITITGLPSTPYYVWLTRTSTMTGMPGDQPPAIVPFQSGIQQDPAEGPYTIGSYVINNGNGRTILDDIAPSTPYLSNTNYYALVTTDTDGRALITFQTSSGTATRTFSVKAENPRSAANSDILIERKLPSGAPTAVVLESFTITSEPAKTTSSTRTEVPVTATIILTTTPSANLTPTPKAAPGSGYCILALMAVLFAGKTRKYYQVV